MNIQLIPASTADKAYERIRADIIFGRLAPAARLRLDRLALDYGASVSTLREILNRLTSEGFVIAEGQRGFQVMPVSFASFQELADLRLLLETSGIAQSFAAGDLEWESRVVAAHHKLAVMERRMQSGDRTGMEQWKRYDREFHQALIAACGSDALLDLSRDVYDQYLRYQMVAVIYRGDAATREHLALLEAALARDATAAIAILTQHVQGCVAHTRETGSLP